METVVDFLSQTPSKQVTCILILLVNLEFPLRKRHNKATCDRLGKSNKVFGYFLFLRDLQPPDWSGAPHAPLLLTTMSRFSVSEPHKDHRFTAPGMQDSSQSTVRRRREGKLSSCLSVSFYPFGALKHVCIPKDFIPFREPCYMGFKFFFSSFRRF